MIKVSKALKALAFSLCMVLMLNCMYGGFMSYAQVGRNVTQSENIEAESTEAESTEVESAEAESTEAESSEEESAEEESTETESLEDSADENPDKIESSEDFYDDKLLESEESMFATGVYEVGSNRYDTFAQALEAVAQGIDTIILQGDAIETNTVTIDKNLTIKLNGYKLEGNLFKISSKVVFDGSDLDGGQIVGKINGITGSDLEFKNCNVYGQIIAKGNNLTITDCNLSFDKKDTSNGIINAAVKENVTIRGGNSDYSYAEEKYGTYAVKIAGAKTVNISNHAISTKYKNPALYFYSNIGTAKVDNCFINGVEIYGIKENNTVTITNSEIITDRNYSLEIGYNCNKTSEINLGDGNTFNKKISIAANTDPDYKYSVNISEGNFTYSSDSGDVVFYNANKTGGIIELKKRINLTGGAFKTDVSEYVAQGYECISDGLGDYNVVKSIGSGPVYILDNNGKTYYPDIDSAVSAAGGNAIYIDADVTLRTEDVKGVTLKGTAHGTLEFGGSLQELLQKGVILDGLDVSCNTEKFSGLKTEEGSLVAGSGFTKDNYNKYVNLIAEGYLFKADSYDIVPAKNYEAKCGALAYQYLTGAITAVENGESSDDVVLLRDTVRQGSYRINTNNTQLCIDLNGFELISVNEGICIPREVTGVELVIKNGKISSKNAILIEAGETDIKVYDCNIVGKDFGIVTNGSKQNVTITLENTDVSADNYAMYLAANGKTEIKGGNVTGKTGIELRAGELNITGSKISGTGTFSEAPNSSGGTTEGVGIAVVQHVTKHPVNVILTDCDITGTENAVRQRDIQNNGLNNINLKINGGSYSSQSDAVYSENLSKFIYAGTFSSNPAISYIAEGCEVSEQGGKYIVHEIVLGGDASDGTAKPEIDENAVPNAPVVPDDLPAEHVDELNQSHETAKDSIINMSSNAAVAGHPESVDNLADAAEANNLVDSEQKTMVSISQKLTDAEFETIINKDENGNVTGVQVLPKKLVFEITAYSELLNDSNQVIQGSRTEIDMSKNKINNRRTFRFRIPVPSTVTAVYANVEHEGDPVRQYKIEGYGNQKYITVSTWHLSRFTLTFTNEAMSQESSSSGGSHSSILFAQNKPNGTWKLDEIGWWFLKNDGTYPVAQWYECSWNGAKNWYHFNDKGYLDSGWFTEKDGNIYYLHNLHDNNFGYMYTGWNWIGNKCYYFVPNAMVNNGPIGSLVRNTVTPDGYTVNEHGEWTVDGKIQIK